MLTLSDLRHPRYFKPIDDGLIPALIGCAMRRSVTPKEVRATARAYHTQAEVFPNMGHDMMLKPGWVAVAQRIHTWLCTQGL
jgi:pimeloyl-ACP methyl ester carboxylesterase